MRCTAFLLTVIACSGAIAAPSTQPTSPSDRAEIRMLQATVTRQAKEIESMKSLIELLRGKLTAAGIPADATAATPIAAEPIAPTPAALPADRPGRAKNVIFAVDGSGSMINKIIQVQEEVMAAISEMQADQKFTIILFEGEKVMYLDKKLIPVSPANATRAKRFLDSILPSGQGDAEPAIVAAIAMQPDVIWVATDGDMADSRTEIFNIQRLNVGGRIRINTVMAFTGDQPDNMQSVWRMAHANGGICIGTDGSVVEAEPIVNRPAKPPVPAPTPVAPPVQKKPSIFQER